MRQSLQLLAWSVLVLIFNENNQRVVRAFGLLRQHSGSHFWWTLQNQDELFPLSSRRSVRQRAATIVELSGPIDCSNQTIVLSTEDSVEHKFDAHESVLEEIVHEGFSYINTSLTPLLDLNRDLNSLAKQAGVAQSRNQAVAAAATAQYLWENASIDGDRISFNTVLKAWSRVSQTLANLHMYPLEWSGPHQPNTTTNVVELLSVPSYMRVENMPVIDVAQHNVYTANEAVLHASNLLQQTLTSTKTGIDIGNISIVDVISFNIILDAWAKLHDQEAAQHCEALLQQMKQITHIKPDILTYHAVLDALVCSNCSDCWNRLEIVYAEMQQQQLSTARTTHIMCTFFSRMAREDDSKAEFFSVKAVQFIHDQQTLFDECRHTKQQLETATYTAGA